jgi:hypothetical protein
LDLATSGKGGIGTFIGLCAFFACFGIAHALVQGGVSGELSSMCPEFIQVGLPIEVHVFFLVSIVEIILYKVSETTTRFVYLSNICHIL